jgi:hypothetical protein
MGTIFNRSQLEIDIVLQSRRFAVQGLTGRERNLFSKWAIAADDAERRIARAMRICAGNELRKVYCDLRDEPLPPKIADLLRRLDW